MFICNKLNKQILTVVVIFTSALGQSQAVPGHQARRKAPMAVKSPVKGSARTPAQKFALDVLHMAVALPQPDPQDRLRVLTSALEVAMPLDSKLAQSYSRMGAGIEGDLIAGGETPVASVMSTGDVDCRTAETFVDRVYPQNIQAAEQSLIGALSACQSGTFNALRTKADAAMAQGTTPPRLMMALYQAAGDGSAWAQSSFERLFGALPDPQKDSSVKSAPDFAAMYSTMAPKLSKDVARDTGMKFLGWLAKMDEGPERNLAAHIAGDAMKGGLGEDGLRDALAQDVMAQQLLEQAQKGPQDIEHPQDEQVSVLDAMKNTGSDQSDALRQLPASLRARQAAADGFARGNAGDKKGAANYFDIAFSAADEVWAARGVKDVAPLLQEVGEAAAQVDPVNALSRAQHMQDPTAQAITMLAVARVVANQQAQTNRPSN